MIDFSNDPIAVTDKDINTISTLAKYQLAIEKQLKELQILVDEGVNDLRQVQEIDLPLAMQQAGVSEFKLDTGEMVNVVPSLHPSIPKDKKLQAFKWLRDQGHGSLIKNNVTIQFGKGEDTKAIELVSNLKEDGYKPTQKQDVHFQTLKAFVKEQTADPETPDLPQELFNVHEVRKAVIKSS